MPIHCVDRAYLDSNFFVTNARRVRSQGPGAYSSCSQSQGQAQLEVKNLDPWALTMSSNKFGDLVLET